MPGAMQHQAFKERKRENQRQARLEAMKVDLEETKAELLSTCKDLKVRMEKAIREMEKDNFRPSPAYATRIRGPEIEKYEARIRSLEREIERLEEAGEKT